MRNPAPQDPLGVQGVAVALDGEFTVDCPQITYQRSDLTKEAVQQLVDKTSGSEKELRNTLVSFATQREAIPATAYADDLVVGLSREPDPYGRIFSFAVHNAWLDESLHTQFLLECIPRNAAEKRRGAWRERWGSLQGYYSARAFHDPLPFQTQAHQLMVKMALLVKAKPVAAMQALRPVSSTEFFDVSVNLEYAAALGWRVIERAELPRRRTGGATWAQNRRSWRALAAEPGELGYVAAEIALAEVRHAKAFWHLAQADTRVTDTVTTDALAAKLRGVDKAFVAPEFRIPPGPPLPRFKYWRCDPSTGFAPVMRQMLDSVRPSDPGAPVQRRVVLAIGDCSPRTAQVVSRSFATSDRWHFATIGAPGGVTLPQANGSPRTFEFEAGCAHADWPKAWVDADVRISIAEIGTQPSPHLSLGALSRLVQVFPEQLRSTLRNRPSATIYALMWLLEEAPPHFSVALADDGTFYVDLQGQAVAFDLALVDVLRRRRSTGLTDALRWFGPLVPR